MGLNNSQQKTLSVQSTQIEELKSKFCLQNEHIIEMYKVFKEMDKYHQGRINIDHISQYFMQFNPNFIELPYLQHLLTLSKSNNNHIFFEHFLQTMTIFCLMNSQAILQFVFNYIDNDDDSIITKNNIIQAISYFNQKNQCQVFFTNFQYDIHLSIDPNAKITFDQFKKYSDKLMFLIWPAFQLQQKLREKIIGVKFWETLYEKAEKKEYELINSQKKQVKMKAKLKALQSLPLQKINGPFIKGSHRNRACGEVGSDSKLEPNRPPIRTKSCIYFKRKMQYETQVT